jgi:hypothetical protein
VAVRSREDTGEMAVGLHYADACPVALAGFPWRIPIA